MPVIELTCSDKNSRPMFGYKKGAKANLPRTFKIYPLFCLIQQRNLANFAMPLHHGKIPASSLRFLAPAGILPCTGDLFHYLRRPFIISLYKLHSAILAGRFIALHIRTVQFGPQKWLLQSANHPFMDFLP
jgi:hypothetical protein